MMEKELHIDRRKKHSSKGLNTKQNIVTKTTKRSDQIQVSRLCFAAHGTVISGKNSRRLSRD